MISSIYVADAANRLDMELKIIRHFLLNSRAKEVRDAFIANEMNERTQSMSRVLAQEPDCEMVDDLLAQTVLRNQERWLENNLHHLIEFSEKRLNQMELILRYTLFEGFLQKIVGNILWEYPELRSRQVHTSLSKFSTSSYGREKRRLQQHPDGERIAWTIAMVKTVDHLPFSQLQGEVPEPKKIYLETYLRDAFDLVFPQEKLWPTLERLRRIRNRVVHQNMELGILPDTMKDISKYFGGFPTVLAEAAAKKFPNACTIEKSEPGDDGTPGYVLAEEFF